MGTLVLLPSAAGVELRDRSAMSSASAERDAQVAEVLAAATEPLGPTEIGFRVNKPWSTTIAMGEMAQGKSSAVLPVLRRIGAVWHPGGRYTKPENGVALNKPPQEHDDA